MREQRGGTPRRKSMWLQLDKLQENLAFKHLIMCLKIGLIFDNSVMHLIIE